MKKFSFLTIIMLFVTATASFAQVQKAQTLQVGQTSTNTPNASAALQIDDTTRGVLLPRMTTAQRTAIGSPAIGLHVYDTTTNTDWIYNGTAWIESATASMVSKWSVDAANARIYLGRKSTGGATNAFNEFFVRDNGTVSKSKNGLHQNNDVNFYVYNDSLRSNIVSYSDINNNVYQNASVGSVISNQNLAVITSNSANNKNTTASTSNLYVGNNFDGGTAVLTGFNSNIVVGRSLPAIGGSSVQNTFNGSVSNLTAASFGVNFGELAGSTGLVTSATGIAIVNGQYTIGRATVKTAKGINVSTRATGLNTPTSPNTAMGIQISGVLADAANTNRAYGIQIDNNISASGGTDNKAYSVYSLSTADSYFAGNIGVGTLLPAERLDVTGSIKLSGEVKVNVGAGNGNNGVSLISTGAFLPWLSWTDGTTPKAGMRASSFGDLIVYAGGLTERMRFASTGNVGIGVQNPSERLEVSGNILASGQVTLGNTALYRTIIRSNAILSPAVGGTGNGTVITTDGTGVASGHIGFQISANDANDGFFVSTDANTDGTVDTVAMKIVANGNVGFGTTAPVTKLDVNGAIKIGNTTDTPVAGMIRYNGTNFQGYNGTTWVQLNN